jgi:hypothetical protein
MNLPEFKARYSSFFEAVASKTAIAPDTALEISYYLSGTNPKLLKQNNFFALADSKARKYKSYSTPFEGISEGITALVNSRKWTTNKLGTLRANPALQTKRILLTVLAPG